ncbi:MAG: sarcosine oxidase subunit delta [Candidatus Portiera sp.]|nr:sarcosine oxidase subunit delta [Portiera sp.]
MLLIHCPYCGEKREEEEFTYDNEAGIVRPTDPEDLTDEEWGDYVFGRQNLCGPIYESWVHTAGCRKFLIVKRDNSNNKIDKTMTVQEASADKNYQEFNSTANSNIKKTNK